MKASAESPRAGAVPEKGTIGGTIAYYRRTRHNPDTGLPWSQEELALAIGTQQPQVSRIESNRQHPSYYTIMRIAKSLELSPIERTRLLRVAGYEAGTPLPNEEAVAQVVATIAPTLDGHPLPAALIDDSERMWYCNDAHFRLWGRSCGWISRASYLTALRGRRWLELIFDPMPGAKRLPLWIAACDEAEQWLTRHIVLLWRSYHLHPEDPDLERAIAALQQHPGFRERWQRLAGNASDLLFVDHMAYTIQHPQCGPLKLLTWKSRLVLDERFLVVYVSPTDRSTALLLDRVVQK